MGIGIVNTFAYVFYWAMLPDFSGGFTRKDGEPISPTFVSNITEAVMEEVRQWQNRPLDAIYPIVYVD